MNNTRLLTSLVCFLLLGTFVFGIAHAGIPGFGTNDRVVRIESTRMEQDGLQWNVCYHAETSYFLGVGVWMSDKGLVLCAGDSHKPLPEESEIKRYQAMGVFPAVMPLYAIPLEHYINGFFVWIIVGALGLLFFILQAKERRQRQELLSSKLILDTINRGMPKQNACDKTMMQREADVVRALYRELVGEELTPDGKGPAGPNDMKSGITEEQKRVGAVLRSRYVELTSGKHSI